MQLSEKHYTCAIIDNDFNSLTFISHYISLLPKLKLVKAFSNPIQAIKEIKAMKEVDILFLDTNMPVSGIEVAQLLRDHAKCIILTTAHAENALAAFQAEVDDLIVKPISFDKFLKSLNRAFSKSSLHYS